MSYQIKLDEALEALQAVNPDLARPLENILCAAGDAIGVLLAEALDIEAGECTMQGMAFAGICLPLNPRYQDQPLPDALEGLDDDEAWDNDASDLPPMPELSAFGRVMEEAESFIAGFEGDELQEGIDGPDGLLARLRREIAKARASSEREAGE